MINFLKEKWFYILVLIVAVLVPFLVPNRYFFQVITFSCLFAIGALSMNLILGFTGQASLAHGGFFAIGAYTVAIMTLNLGWSFWIVLPIGALMASFIGFLVGIPALRTKGSYFAIATLCLGEIIYLVAGNWVEFTGGHNGLVGIPSPSPITLPGIGYTLTFTTQTAQYYVVLVALLFTLFIMHRVVRSLKGLTFMAIRNNEDLAEAVGIDTFKTKLLSFMVANFFAGLAGGIYASVIGSISPSVASIGLTFNFLLYVLLGGVATLAGPIIGAFALPLLMENLQFLKEFQMIMFGVLLIFVIIYFPRGFMGGFNNLKEKIKKSKMGA